MALVLAACSTPAGVGSRDEGVDAAVDAGIPAGSECPLGTGCAAGLRCSYVIALNRFLCTTTCERFADCAAVGFDDSCCAPWPPGVDGSPPPICLPSALCGAADGGAASEPGAECVASAGTCSDGLECRLVERYYGGDFACTRGCETFSDCAASGFTDGCCARIDTDAAPRLCLPRSRCP